MNLYLQPTLRAALYVRRGVVFGYNSFETTLFRDPERFESVRSETPGGEDLSLFRKQVLKSATALFEWLPAKVHSIAVEAIEYGMMSRADLLRKLEPRYFVPINNDHFPVTLTKCDRQQRESKRTGFVQPQSLIVCGDFRRLLYH